MELNIVVVEGEGAINNVRQRAARAPVVRVEEQNHKPIAGAAVAFTLPTGGASGEFSNGALRRNSWKSTPIEGVAGNLVIQQERPPSETVARSPSIRPFSAFVCPPRFSDLRPPPTSG